MPWSFVPSSPENLGSPPPPSLASRALSESVPCVGSNNSVIRIDFEGSSLLIDNLGGKGGSPAARIVL